MSASRISPFRWLAPGGTHARLSVFIFHRVLPQPDPLLPDEPDAVHFDRIVGFIARQFNVLSMTEAVQRLTHHNLPPAAACITFDDGYADNLTVATPILRKYEVSATFFIATGYIGGGRMWNDTIIESIRLAPAGEIDLTDLGLSAYLINDSASRVNLYQGLLRTLKHRAPADRQAVADEIGLRMALQPQPTLMLNSGQVRELNTQGMEVGAHTITHPILSKVDEATAKREIGGSAEILTSWLGERPKFFAYPNGVPEVDYGVRDTRLVREAGFHAATSTASGVNGANADVFQLRRFTPWDRSMAKFGLRCAHNLLARAQQPVVPSRPAASSRTP